MEDMTNVDLTSKSNSTYLQTLSFREKNARLIHWQMAPFSKVVSDSLHFQYNVQFKMRQD